MVSLICDSALSLEGLGDAPNAGPPSGHQCRGQAASECLHLRCAMLPRAFSLKVMDESWPAIRRHTERDPDSVSRGSSGTSVEDGTQVENGTQVEDGTQEAAEAVDVPPATLAADEEASLPREHVAALETLPVAKPAALELPVAALVPVAEPSVPAEPGAAVVEGSDDDVVVTGEVPSLNDATLEDLQTRLRECQSKLRRRRKPCYSSGLRIVCCNKHACV